VVYLDTSALAKWYLNEPRSEDFARWIQDEDEAWISALTMVEMRCLLARRRRSGEITATVEEAAFARFPEDVDRADLLLQPLEDRTLGAALALIGRLAPCPLRTLDAIHLSIALGIETERLATADGVMAEAAAALGLEAVWFGPPAPR
jgi:hypothetical protein